MLFNLAPIALLLAPFVLGEARYERVQGEKKHGSYIVKMKRGLSRTSVLSKIGEGFVRHKYGKQLMNGFAGDFDEKMLETIRAHPDVEAVYEDGIAYVAGLITQTSAPWGLERISKAAKIVPHADLLSYTYVYDSAGGQGVDVYVLDTGVNVEHIEFEGRAKWGPLFASDYPEKADNLGHGTHCAGIIGSRAYGVAKKVNIIAIKVLNDGLGSWSDIIAGMDYVIQQKAVTGRPSIISMSLSGLANELVDDAVAAATNAGVHFITGAGYSTLDSDAMYWSPARAPSAITVGATNITDARDSSNSGSLVDVYAPGTDILSTYIRSTTATATMSGTSMSTAHVAGLVAYLISLHGDKTPADMTAYLQATSLKNLIPNLPVGTVNDLAYNGVA